MSVPNFMAAHSITGSKSGSKWYTDRWTSGLKIWSSSEPHWKWRHLIHQKNHYTTTVKVVGSTHLKNERPVMILNTEFWTQQRQCSWRKKKSVCFVKFQGSSWQHVIIQWGQKKKIIQGVGRQGVSKKTGIKPGQLKKHDYLRKNILAKTEILSCW